MSSIRPPKKTGTIGIRLSDEAKAAFMERCRRDGRTASEAIRLFIDEQVAARTEIPQRRAPSWRIAIAAIVGATLGLGAAAPSLARSVQQTRPAFDQLDRDHDGVLTFREFQAH
jgi:hypothetical protein